VLLTSAYCKKLRTGGDSNDQFMVTSSGSSGGSNSTSKWHREVVAVYKVMVVERLELAKKNIKLAINQK